MRGGDGFAGGCERIHRVCDAAQVLVEHVVGVLHVHVGLLGATDFEDVAVVAEPVRVDFGALTAGELNVRHYFTPASRLKVLTRSSTEEEESRPSTTLSFTAKVGVPFTPILTACS